MKKNLKDQCLISKEALSRLYNMALTDLGWADDDALEALEQDLGDKRLINLSTLEELRSRLDCILSEAAEKDLGAALSEENYHVE